MSWFKRKLRAWLEVPDAPIETDADVIRDKLYNAGVPLNAAMLLFACQERLADDNLLLDGCREYLNASRYHIYSGNLYDRLIAERKRIELRIAQANLKTAQESVKAATKRVRGK